MESKNERFQPDGQQDPQSEVNQMIYHLSVVYRKPEAHQIDVLDNRVLQIEAKVCDLCEEEQAVQSRPAADFSKIYPILSSLSTLETYLELGRKYRVLDDTQALNLELSRMKEKLTRMLGRIQTSD